MIQRFLILFVVLVFAFNVSAQNITGTSPANLGDEVTYTFNDGAFYTFANWVPGGSGTVITKWNVGTTYYATIQWTAVGTITLEFRDQAYTLRGSKSVTIQVGVPNTTFTTIQNCGSSDVTRNTAPASGINWYWQTTSTGTSTTLGFAATINRTSAGALYLRARQGTSGGWSATSQSVGTISIISSTAVPSSSTNGNIISASSASVPLIVNPVSGATSYKWYTVSSGGTAISGATTNTYSPTIASNTSQVFYVEAVTGACASTTRKSVTGYVHPVPVLASSNNGDLIMSGNVVLSVSNFTYDTYKWIDGQGSFIPGATNSTYSASAIGNYQLQVVKGNSPPFTTGVITVSTRNYIISEDILKSGVTNTTSVDGLPIEHKSQVTKFFDGLGRPEQTVNKQGSPTLKDVVQQQVYDPYGRETIKYLPYTDGNNGWFKLDALKNPSTTETTQPEIYRTGKQYSFYQGGGIVASDQYPYAESKLENSPLNRVREQGSPGAAWKPDATDSYGSSDRTVKMSYETNVANEVKLWIYTASTANTPIRMLSTGYYPADQLYKTKTRDEEYNEVIEFKDNKGKVILKKVQAPAGAWANTYYIYDDFGNLVVVLPPEAVVAFESPN